MLLWYSCINSMYLMLLLCCSLRMCMRILDRCSTMDPSHWHSPFPVYFYRIKYIHNIAWRMDYYTSLFSCFALLFVMSTSGSSCWFTVVSLLVGRYEKYMTIFEGILILINNIFIYTYMRGFRITIVVRRIYHYFM